MVNDELTAERARELLNYDPDTGAFTRKMSPGNQINVGDVAGCIGHNGYRVIRLDGRLYYAGRLAFLITYGCWPNSEVDHINGVRDDNRITNLRKVSHRKNGQNRFEHRAGKLCGTHLKRDAQRSKPWQAQICIDGKYKSLGHFATEREAHEAYVNKLAEIGEKLVGAETKAGVQ